MRSPAGQIVAKSSSSIDAATWAKILPLMKIPDELVILSGTAMIRRRVPLGVSNFVLLPNYTRLAEVVHGHKVGQTYHEDKSLFDTYFGSGKVALLSVPGCF